LHHVDFDIKNKSNNIISEFKCLYFGNKHRTIFTSKISKYVNFKFIDSKDYRNNDFSVLNKYNIHYCIDAYKNYEIYKPLTKVFLAAEYNSIVIIGRHEESQYYLGKKLSVLC